MPLSDVLAIWGLVIGVLGLIATAVGFIIAILQLRKQTTAAEATKDAIESANQRMLYNHLLVLLPALIVLEADIDAAMTGDDRPGAVRALVNFSHTANQIAALLDANGREPELAEQLRVAARNASKQKAAIVSGVKKTVGALLVTLAAEISEVSGRCSGLTTTYQTKVA